MEKIAIIHGSYIGKDEKDHCYMNGDMQKRFEDFSKDRNILEITSKDHTRLIVRYTDN